MKKLLLSILGVLIALPGLARDFTYEYEGQTLTYTVLDENAKTCKTKEGNNSPKTSGNKVTGDLIIPSIAKDGDVEYTVTSISRNAFYGCSGLNSVTIPESVTSIYKDAFSGCTELKNLIFEDGSTTITLSGGNSTGIIIFTDCPLETIYVGRNIDYDSSGNKRSPFYNMTTLTTLTFGPMVTKIDYYLFDKCTGLTSVTLSESITEIGGCAFKGCTGLKSITIPKAILSIQFWAFQGCSGLETIFFNAENCLSCSYSKGYYQGLGNWGYVFPSSVKEIIFGDNVKNIPSETFGGCNLTSVIIPPTVTSIGTDVFKDCPKTIKGAYPSNLSNPFNSYAVEYDPEGMIIENGFIYGPEKKTLYFAPMDIEGEFKIPNSVNTVAANAFFKCENLTSIFIPSSVNSIGSRAFKGCQGLKNLKFEDNTETIMLGGTADGKELFSDCPLETLYLGRNISFSKNSPFISKPNLVNLSIGSQVTSINERMFSECTGLKAVTIPNAVTQIGSYAFNGCSGLKSVIISPSVTEIGIASFAGCFGIIRCAYPDNLSYQFPTKAYKFAYASANSGYLDGGIYDSHLTTLLFAPWAEGEYTVPDKTTAIGDNAFNNCAQMTSIILPTNLRTIGKDVFSGCPSFTSVTSLASPAPLIDETSFTDQYETASVNIPAEIIGDYTSGYNNWRLFKSLKALDTGSSETFDYEQLAYRMLNDKDVEIVASEKYTDFSELIVPSTLQIPVEKGESENPEEDAEPEFITLNVMSIAPNAFANLKNLTSVTVSEGIIRVGSAAFKGCNALTDVRFPSTVTEISSSTFQNCENLSQFTSDAQITKVGTAAFAKTALTVANLPYVSTIGEFAYADIPTLQELKTGENLKTISRNAFQNCGLQAVSLTSPILAEIGENAFSSNTDLATINIKNSVPLKIGKNAFASNANITTVTLHNEDLLEIADNAFASCDKLTTVNFESSAVLKIGQNAFSSNSSLEKVELMSSASVVIADNAFASNTKLTEVTLGDGVTSVGNSAFAGCSKITALKIGKDVATIGDNAFSGAPLTRSLAFVKDGALRHIGKYAFQSLRVRGELSLPDKVEYIGNGAFAYPRSLTKIVLPANRNLVVCDSAFTHAQRVSELVFPDTVKSIGKHAFADLQAEGMTELNIKAHNIGEEAFATESTETHITKLAVAGNGTLGVRAFKGLTALTEASVEIPEISESAFADLNQLSNIHFGDNIERIAPSAFANCAIENLAFPTVENPAAVTVVEAGAFVGNPLKHLSLGNRMKQIDLLNINIGTYYTDQTVDLGSTVQRIERGAFKYLKSLTLPSSLEYISTEISTDSLNIPASSTEITINTRVTVKHLYIDRKYSTRYSFASKFDLLANDGVYSLTCGETKDAGVIIYGFEDYIKDVHIGASVQSISTLRVSGKISFSEGIERIRSLDVSVRDTKTLKLPGSLKEITSLGIAGVETLIFGDSSEPLTLSSGAIRGYQNQSSAFKPKEVYIGRDITGTFTFTPWASTIEKVVIGDNVSTVNDGLFKDCAAITNVVMSDNVTTIGNEAFSGCSGLKVLSLSEKVTTIGDNAYSGCTNLERIVARGLTPAVGNAGFGTEVEDNVPLYVHDEVIDDYYDSDLFYPFNINPFSGNIVKEVTTENELTEEYEPGETFSIPESVSMIIDRYPEYVIDPEDPEDPNEPVMSRSKVRRAAAAEETDLTKSFYYFSPDPDILTVDQTGTVTVRKEGEGRIWAYVLDGSDRKVEIGVNKFALEDFNHDGVIDSDDLQMLVNHIANPAESKIPSEKADLTKDGGVDSDDIQYHVNKIISK